MRVGEPEKLRKERKPVRVWARRWVALWLAVVMLGGSALGWAVPACGGEAPGAQAARVKGARITLEEAIALAKQFVRIPEEYKNFQPGYSEDEKQGVFWELHWSSDEHPDSDSIYARINAETGELWSLDQWKTPAPGTARRGFPKLSRADAVVKAGEFLKRVLPNYVKDLKLDSEDGSSFPYVSLRDGMPPVYSFNFVRMVGGIPFPENSASVEVDANTGEVRSFHFNWDGRLEFPEAKDLIAPDQAAALWRKNAGVRLAYFRQGEERDAPARLVFAPEARELMIDARSGEILKPERHFDYYGFEMGGAGGGEHRAMKSAPLTPAEQAALAEMEKLISREKALDLARSQIEIPPGFDLESSSLQQEYFSGQKVWNFYWRNKDEERSLNVGVEAGKGQVVSFNLSGPGPEPTGEPRITEAGARDMASRFLARVAGSYLGELEELRVAPVPGPYPVHKPAASEPGQVKPKPVAYGFTAARLVNGIPFRGNGVQIYVDAVQGKITSYRLNWWEMKFPEARGVISREQAENVFLAGGSLVLCYRRDFPTPYQPPEDRPIRLVYALDTGKSPVYVDAFQGTGLDYDFQPKQGADQMAFSDLSGHPAAGAVNLLAKARIIPVFEAAFHPEARLSQRDFLIWLVRASGWQPRPASDPDREFEKACRQALMLGILKPGEQYSPREDLSKLALARLVVRALGWDEVAGLASIWSLPPGLAGLPASEQGCLALAAGLGIFDLNKGFDPGSGLTRAEGASALYQILNRS